MDRPISYRQVLRLRSNVLESVDFIRTHYDRCRLEGINVKKINDAIKHLKTDVGLLRKSMVGTPKENNETQAIIEQAESVLAAVVPPALGPPRPQAPATPQPGGVLVSRPARVDRIETDPTVPAFGTQG